MSERLRPKQTEEKLPTKDANRINDLNTLLKRQLAKDGRETIRVYALKTAIRLDQKLSLARAALPPHERPFIATDLGFIRRKRVGITVEKGIVVLVQDGRDIRELILGESVKSVVCQFLGLKDIMSEPELERQRFLEQSLQCGSCPNRGPEYKVRKTELGYRCVHCAKYDARVLRRIRRYVGIPLYTSI